MKILDNRTIRNYTLSGVIFGLCFPLLGVGLWAMNSGISFFEAQTRYGNILIWTIDLAPLVLGIVFYF